MEKLNTIQKRNKLNEVCRNGGIGAGGAYHEYIIYHNAIDTGKTMKLMSSITFQEGPRNESYAKTGVLDVDLLEIVRDRLTCFQNGDFACGENEMALRHVEEALLWLNKRVEDRAERGVLGTEEK